MAVKNEKSFSCHSPICVVSEWNVSERGAANTAPRILSRGGALFCSPPNLPLQESKTIEIKILTRRNSITGIGATKTLKLIQTFSTTFSTHILRNQDLFHLLITCFFSRYLCLTEQCKNKEKFYLTIASFHDHVILRDLPAQHVIDIYV